MVFFPGIEDSNTRGHRLKVRREELKIDLSGNFFKTEISPYLEGDVTGSYRSGYN